MTIGEFIQKQLDELNLNDEVQEKNLEYNWVRFKRISGCTAALDFAKFCVACELVEIRGNEDGSVTCWF